MALAGLAAWRSARNVLALSTRAGGPPGVVGSSGAAAGLHGLQPGGQDVQALRVLMRRGHLRTAGEAQRRAAPTSGLEQPLPGCFSRGYFRSTPIRAATMRMP